MSAFRFAWRTLVRQPARAALGVLGVAAVGALLFDMLLLANGLIISMRELLDRSGFEVRVTATPALPGSGPRISDAATIAQRMADLPEVDEAVALKFANGEVQGGNGHPLFFALFGTDRSRRRGWTIASGNDLSAEGEIVINDNMASTLGRGPGDTIVVHASCGEGQSALPPVTLRIAGIADFPFDTVRQMTGATSRRDIERACGTDGDDDADMILVAGASGADPEQTRAAIARIEHDLVVMTNAQVVGRLDASGFSYFRQISAVLATVTTAFGLLLITVLLTVSVNQRLGTIAALRAIGFSQRRVMADVICESALMVGGGGLLAIPLGFLLAEWLDRILTRIPGLPGGLHFFVFEPRALVTHLVILVATAILAAAYPLRLVARLPITATLRDEMIS